MKDLTSGNPAKLIILFTIPMLFGNLFQQLYNVVDSIIVGRYIGKEALAAVGASFPIFFLLISFTIGLTMGMGILISQYFGARDFSNVKKTISTAYIFILFFSLMITICGIILAPLLLKLIKTPADVLPQAIIYLQILFLGIIPLFGYNSLSAILRAVGDSKTPLYFLIISSLLNVILDILLVIIFKMGIAGAAWATIIAEGCAFFLGVIYLRKSRYPFLKPQLNLKGFNFSIMQKIVKIGLPSGFQQMTLALSAMIFTALVNNFGSNVIAAYSAASRIEFIVFLPAMNFSIGIATFVGQNIGAGKLERVRQGFISTMFITISISVLLSGLIILNRHFLINIFTLDQKVITIGGQYLLIVASSYFLLAAMFVTNGVIRGAGATFAGMAFTIFSLLIIRLPVAYLLSGKIGLTGLWISFPASWASGFLLSFYYYISGKWKEKKIAQPVIAEEIYLTD